MRIGFKRRYFGELAELEEESFWFRSRNKLIFWALHNYASELKSFLDIGCGTGFVLSGISKRFPNIKLVGGEYLEDGLSYAQQRVPTAEFTQMDARCIPYKSVFDAIGVFDVLEHIEDDKCVLGEIRGALKLHGIMLLTVPQHTWMWSSMDDYACHVRRYSAKEIHEKVKDSGFEILRSTSFIASLLPAMLVSRMMRRNHTPVKSKDLAGELQLYPWLNMLFEKILDVEIAMIRHGVSFPLGGSRLIVARKI